MSLQSGPFLPCEDEKTAAEFLKVELGLPEIWRTERRGGGARICFGLGESVVLVARANPQRDGIYSPRQTGKATAEVNVSVNDIDTRNRRALDFGLTALDPEGNHWHFMQRMNLPNP